MRRETGYDVSVVIAVMFTFSGIVMLLITALKAAL